ncbi:MAG: helix-turn-helix domain-containing protein [Bryobacteraceae bacterium]
MSEQKKTALDETGTCATYTVAEAAKKLGISRLSAYLAVQRGEIPAVHIGRRILVPKIAFEDLLADARPKNAAACT